MVNEPAAEDAVAMASKVPGLRVGLHLALCDGRASDGAPLPRTPGGAGLRFAFWPGARAWLRREVEAQFARFVQLGVGTAYWDGHTHLHLHPAVMRIALPIAQRNGFRATRLVREPGPPAVLPWIFRKLSNRAVPRLREAGITFTDYVFGLRKTGRMDLPEFERAIEWSKKGATEIYFHPGAERGLPPPETVAELLRRA
jgi:predicted glycoside hydrolase/deacetylase ChbG (UPF0249 family)